MRFIKRRLSVLLLVVACCLFSGSLIAADDNNDVLQLCLELYKLEEFLPGIDLLQSSSEGMENNFNYWLYLGLGFQRTGQTENALKAYSKAFEINKTAGNLSSRIRTLRLETKHLDYKKVELADSSKKASYLMSLARKLRKEYQLDRAYRVFLQALNYDSQLLSKDEGFITQAEVFYGLKKSEHAEFFQGLFQLLQGDIENSEKNLKFFLKNPERKPSIYISRAEDSLKKIKSLKETALASANIEKKPAEKDRISALPKIVEERKKPVNNVKTRSQENVDTLDQEISSETGSRFVMPDSGFVEFFAGEVARKMITELSQTDETERKCRLIWELGNSGLQNSEVMSALITQLESPEIPVLTTTLEAIGKIGSPSAGNAVDVLLALIEHDEPLVKFLAIETLGRIKEQPEKVIPVLAKDYAAENDIYLKRHLYYWVNKFGRPGLKILYNELEETPRVDRKPVAELISRITGEKIQALIDR